MKMVGMILYRLMPKALIVPLNKTNNSSCQTNLSS